MAVKEMQGQKKLILKLLNPGSQKARMYGSWLALCLGLILLFAAVIAWADFSQLLSGKGKAETMASYIVIGKQVTNESMSQSPGGNLFSEKDIQDLAKAKGVRAVGQLQANNFPVSASLGGNLGFYTELFLAATDDRYLDLMPEDWHWQPGQNSLPIIMSSDFLNLYNYGFALSQGLPQLSQASVRSLPFEISIARGAEKYRAQIVGFTDRISSILVPQGFMDEMNRKYAGKRTAGSSRLIVKVEDPSDPAFVSFLESNKYTTNQEQLRWSRIRTAVQAIVSTVGAVALIVVGMAVLSFILFVEITVRRSSDHISLLRQLGYAPALLRKTLNRFFLPWLTSAVIVAALIACGLHMVLVQWLSRQDLAIAITDGWVVLPVILAILVLMFLLLKGSVARILRKV